MDNAAKYRRGIDAWLAETRDNHNVEAGCLIPESSRYKHLGPAEKHEDLVQAFLKDNIFTRASRKSMGVLRH